MPNGTPSRVSVIIVSYYTGPILSRCLESVVQQEGLHEIILVDNGNSEEVRKSIAGYVKEHPLLKYRSGQGNIGFAAGCNVGAAQATGDYILLLNPDCVLPKRALAEIMNAMQDHPDAWMAGCQLLSPDGVAQPGNKRRLLSPGIALAHALHLHALYKAAPHMHIPESESDGPEYVPAISGAFMCLRRSRYHEIGGLDEGYFFHVEDLDLCKTIATQGGKILYVPSVKVVHYRSSSKVTSFFIERHKTDGFVRYFRKFYRGGLGAAPYVLMVAAIYARMVLKWPLHTISGWAQKRRMAQEAVREKRQLRWLAAEPPYLEMDRTRLKKQAPVLIAGATGQVGLSVMRRCLAEDMRTYALYHNRTIDFRHPRLTWLQGDVASGYFPFLAQELDEAPKTLVHTPAIWHLPPQIEKLRALGITRIVAFSSTSIEGKARSQNDYELALVERFVKAEEALKKACKAHGVTCTILRPTMIYGSGLDRNISAIVGFIRRFGFFPVIKPGNGKRQPVHNDDLTQAVMLALQTDASEGQTYNLGGGTVLAYDDMVRRLFETLGKTPRLFYTVFLPYMLDVYALLTRNPETNGEVARRMNQDLMFDNKKAERDLGYRPRPFLDGGKADLGMDV